MYKIIIIITAAVVLPGCGLATGPMFMLMDQTPDYIDVSDSENVATIRGATRNVLLGHVVCWIKEPVKARKVKINAGPTEIAVACAVVGSYVEAASFSFDAIADHEYRIRMHVPGGGNIDLVDDTNNKVIGVHKQL